MMIAIFPNLKKHPSTSLSPWDNKFLTSHGIKVVAEDEDAAAINAIPISKINPKEIDFLFTMGGDGTILRIVHQYAHLNAAIIGINLGHLGFMADIPMADVYPACKISLKGITGLKIVWPSKENLLMENPISQSMTSLSIEERIPALLS